MTNYEKILLFRCLLGLLTVGKVILWNFLSDGDRKTKNLEMVKSLQREVSSHVNRLYEEK